MLALATVGLLALTGRPELWVGLALLGLVVWLVGVFAVTRNRDRLITGRRDRAVVLALTFVFVTDVGLAAFFAALD
jgi:hypothetical protein